MTEELNPKLKKQLEDIITAAQDPKSHQKEQFIKIADGLARSLQVMPVCFWVRLFEITRYTTNPILHTMSCQKYNASEDKCTAGHDMKECRFSCCDYLGELVDYCAKLRCDNHCYGPHTIIITEEGETDAGHADSDGNSKEG